MSSGGKQAKEVARIRAATPEDVPGILPLVGKLTELHQRHDPERFKVRPDVLDRYAAWLPERARDPRSVLLIAESGARLVAFLVGTIEPEVPIFWVPECGWIHDVWVEPEFRGAGLARELVERACDRFQELGVKQARLHTGMFNDAARRVFGRAGFRACVVEMLRPLGSA
jgi:GNAT superfamily N-acetyltransferase